MRITLRLMRSMKHIFVSVTVIMTVTSNHVAAAEKFEYKIQDLDGVEYRASDSIGKWLIINFWATMCTPCLREMPELQKFYQNNR